MSGFPKRFMETLPRAYQYEHFRRLEKQAEFIPVAGQVDNQTQPDMLYRSCRFEGNDIWWVLRK